MTFTKNQILILLNLDFDIEFIISEVEIRDSEKSEELNIDVAGRYFIIRK